MTRPKRILDGDGRIIERDAELFEHLDKPYAGNDTLFGCSPTTLRRSAGSMCSAMIQDPARAVALARAYNDWFADRDYGRSKRLRGMALVPLQEVPEANVGLETVATAVKDPC